MLHENQSWKFLLKWKKNDLFILGSSVLPILLIWIYLFINESLDNVLSYNNADQYIYIAKHFYNTADKQGKYSPNLLKNARILPTTPILIYILHLLTFGNWKLAAFLYILLTSSLASFLFYRFLLVFKFPSSFYYAISLSFHPIKYIIYRSVVDSSSLFLCFMFTALISVKISSYKISLISIFLALLTNCQGITLYLSVCSYLFLENRKFNWPISHFLLLFPLAFTILGIIHLYFTNNFFAYFSQEFLNSNEYCPFVSIFLSCFEIGKLWAFHGQFIYYMLGFIGIIFLSMKSTFLTIHFISIFLYLMLTKYEYTYDQGIQFEIFVILSLDDFVAAKNVKKIIPIFASIYALIGFFVSARSIDYA